MRHAAAFCLILTSLSAEGFEEARQAFRSSQRPGVMVHVTRHAGPKLRFRLLSRETPIDQLQVDALVWDARPGSLAQHWQPLLNEAGNDLSSFECVSAIPGASLKLRVLIAGSTHRHTLTLVVPQGLGEGASSFACR